MDDETKEKIVSLERKIADLVSKYETLAEGFEHEGERHFQHHMDLDKLVAASYRKTHPEFCKSMDQFGEIFTGWKRRGDKPKG